uniref:DUF6824 domain-containing protein n=1 Tax=Craspedostauros australis TaxID=1486917 RepID=A0A7R9ZNL5_9STRA|mmetsp:Transcript_20089/g.55931  ORF Transcript_20089/g.55931 Transcript_20089/m.55931 type:complete len:439 (+) Transcript_20089:377-1693(+)
MQSPPPDQFDGELLDAERQQAREINALSLQERETLYEDIHGVRRPIEETEEFRQEHLQRLETELTVGLYDSKRKYKLPIKNTEIKEAYIITSFLAPRITSDVNLRLTMLRATHWDVQEAAMKTMKYFHAKQKLFGKEVCLRPLVFGDLQQDAQESMEQGAFKIHDDGEGICFRPMMLNLTNRWKTGTALSLAQAIFYSTHMFGRTVRAQQRGVVGIIYTIGTDLAHFRRALAAVRFNMIDATPMRPAGMHMCFSNTRIKPVLSAVLKALPKAFRIRFKLHFGSPRECNRELMTYGVPASLLPDEDSIACGGVAVPEMITKCLARDRDALQRYYAGKPKECIEGQPQPRDILLGRGRPYQKYPGNMDFAQLLQKRKTSYNDPLKTKSEKTELTKQLVKELRDAGVRFLKRDKSGDWWQEVPDTVARERVAMSLRNLSRK